MKRRNILIGLGVVAAGTAAGGAWWLSTAPRPLDASPGAASTGGTTTLAAASTEMEIFPDDHVLGDPAAPITIIEYASLTCGHCGSFHRDTLPQVKAEWIDSGRAKLVFRHYPLDQVALRAAAVADCVKGDGFFGFLDVLFQNQDTWAGSQDPITPLSQYAALAGLDKAAFEACLSDEAAIDRILEKQTDGRDKYNVASTPSFVVNGTPVVGNRPYEEFRKILEEAATKAS